MFTDARLHTNNHPLSVIHAKGLVDAVFPKMSFEEDDVIMEIGCATGDNTKDIILSRIPKLKKLIAIDIIPEMIDFARLHYADDKIEYHVADIEDKSSLQEWKESASKIFSVNCFHWVKDQMKAFQGLHYLLRSKGETAFVFMLSLSMWECYPSIINNVKWNKYLKDVDQYIPESHHLHLGSDYFKNIFEDLGFEVLVCEEETKVNPISDKMKYGFQAHSSLTKYIPDELKGEFADDLFNEHRKRSYSPEGLHIIKIRMLTVHLRKP